MKLSSTNSWNSLTFLCNKGQKVADGQRGHTNTALASEEGEKVMYCFIYKINRGYKEVKFIGPI